MANAMGVALWSITAAFGTYFCMYAFRKPFTAATYADVTLWGIGYKTILVSAQVLGYTLSKFIGIKIVAEIPPHRRAIGILLLIGIAEIALFFFGLVPIPFNSVFLFINGLPLGMVFGLVLGFLEGRRMTEALTAGLCASFILADGVTKSVGAWLLGQGVSEYWMPMATGLLFLPPLALFVWMLARIPPPTHADVAERCERIPMNSMERSQFFGRYAPGLILLVTIYLLITILRSIRADFAPEIWKSLGQTIDKTGTPGIKGMVGPEIRKSLGQTIDPDLYTRSEIFVALGVLVLNGCAAFIRDNRRAFRTSLATCLAGLVLIAVAVGGQHLRLLAGFPFMVLVGLGLYLPYVAVHTTVFERLIAMTRDRGNLSFLMYVADAFGYLGYVAVMFGRGIFSAADDFLGFFLAACSMVVVVSVLCLAICWQYFAALPRAPLVKELASSDESMKVTA